MSGSSVTLWTVTLRAPLSMGFFSQARILEWVACPSLQGIFLTQGSNLCLLHWQGGSLYTHTRAHTYIMCVCIYRYLYNIHTVICISVICVCMYTRILCRRHIICLYTHRRVCIHVCAYVFMYACVHVCTHM